MTSARCMFNAAATFAGVFRPPGLEPRWFSSPLSRLLAPRLVLPARPQSRTYIRGNRQNGGDYWSRTSPMPSTVRRLPRDGQVEAQYRLIVVKRDGGLSEPMPPSRVIAGLDLRVDSLVTVAVPRPDGPLYAICQVMSRNELADEEREKAEMEKSKLEKAKLVRKQTVHTKELELNWGIDPHDLGHRLRTAASFLRKGYKVEIRLVAKKRKRKASMDEAAELLKKVRGLMEEVPGSKETRAVEGELLGSLKLFLEGPPEEARKAPDPVPNVRT